MIEIIPAIMPHDYDELVEKTRSVVDMVPMVQVDIMDGNFVEGKTWPFNEHEESNFQAICREEEGMPYWEQLDYELDLMIKHPDENFEQWIALGPKRLVVHIESLKNPKQALEYLQEYREFVQIGLSFDDTYPIENITPYIDYVDFIQCMGIDEIGAQGEPFSEKVIENLQQLREQYSNLPLSVDGAVNRETAERLVQAGANRLVAGSAIFGDGDVVENLEELGNLVQ